MPLGKGRAVLSSRRKTAEVPSAPISEPLSTTPSAGIATCESMIATATAGWPSIPVFSSHAGLSGPAAVPIGSGSLRRSCRPGTMSRG